MANVEVETLIRCAALGILGIICVGGNILVLRTIFCYKQPRVPIYIIIGGLSIADLINVCFEIPKYVITSTYEGKVLNEAWCKANNYLVSTCTYVAAYHLVGLSIVRCILLTDRSHTKSHFVHAILSSVIIWVVMVLANIPIFTTSSRKDEEIEDCTSTEADSERNIWLHTAFSYILPLVVILAVYVATHFFSKRFFEESYSRRELRLSKMVSFLIVTFAICKLPYEVLHYMVFYKAQKLLVEKNINVIQETKLYLLYYKLFEYASVFALVDQAVRPIIYAKLSWYFSASFDQIINCVPCREQRKDRRQSRRRTALVPSRSLLNLEIEESPALQHEANIEMGRD